MSRGDYSPRDYERKSIMKINRSKVKDSLGYYAFLLPGLIALLLFKYYPMRGLLISFQDFDIFAGIGDSPWVGLLNFHNLFTSRDFLTVFRNTLIISCLKIIILFPFGVFIALVLNEVRSVAYKRFVQTVIYIPHFFSWVVVASLMTNFFSVSGGLVNRIIESLGGKSIGFMVSNSWFRSILVFSAGWKESGWNAIVYIAAIAGIDQELYEAASIDGAGRVGKIVHITLPSIMPTVTLMFILRIGSLLDAGTQQILVMYNPVVYDVADVIGTYVYRFGIGKMEYSPGAAAGLFNSVVGLILVITANWLSRKFRGVSIW